MREVKYWDLERTERLEHTTIDDAMVHILDGYEEDPEFITLVGYAQKEIDLNSIYMLESIYEDLDEEYSDYEGDPSVPSPLVIAAFEKFLEVVESEYEVWACEEITRQVVNVADWRRR